MAPERVKKQSSEYAKLDEYIVYKLLKSPTSPLLGKVCNLNFLDICLQFQKPFEENIVWYGKKLKFLMD